MTMCPLEETRGRQQCADSLIAGHLEDLTPLLGRLVTRGREFR